MRASYLLTVLAGLVALAGCDRNKPDEAPQRNDVTEMPKKAPAQKPVRNLSQGATSAATASANLADPPQISEEQQMLDDADATGLTTRLPEVSEATPPSSEGTGGSAQQR